MMFGLSDD